MFEVAAATLHVVVFAFQQRPVKTQYGRQLFARRLRFTHRREHTRDTNEFGFVSSAGRKAMQLLEQICLGLRRTHLALLDSEMFEYLVDGRVADVIDQLQRAKPPGGVRRAPGHAQKPGPRFKKPRPPKPCPAKFVKRNARAPKL